jgi:ABC-type uncharacterized transport system permease subunit
MSLSPAPLGTSAAALAALSLFALLAYGLVAASRLQPLDAPKPPRWPSLLLPLAWAAQFAALCIDVGGWGQEIPGARFGFAPALSMTIWLVLTVYLVESRFLPLQSVRRGLALLAAAAVALAWAYPGEAKPAAVSAWAPLHWMLGLASYGLFGVAVLHAALMNRAEQRLRAGGASGGGLPLLRLERLTFQFVGAGVVVLSVAILLGWWFSPTWRWDHKTLLAMLGWLVLSGLLAGRRLYGWRGRRATRWLYAGAGILLLAYVGTHFVLEVILQRSAQAGA